ncbi:MAG: DNA primase [Chloroflexi bacterium]|nr:DNA primase [Chloroflexota bacterium]MBU1747136.1 DNA primase [Chloroflexota bacterium]MBU1878676.1 DNA primase [Chloroflexota bacterium]
MSVVDDVKERIDIVDLIGQTVPLKKAGRNYKGLCPFHAEKTPSFVVFPDGHYHCFGCSESGDVFTFLIKTQNLDFSEALRELAQRAGVPLVAREAAQRQDQERDRLFEITAAAAQYWHNLLLNADAARPARAYLEQRGVSAATIEAFQLGYALDSWDALGHYLASRGYPTAEVEAAGLIIAREQGPGHYDRFRGRLMFAIRDARGQTIGFGARTLQGDEHPKYLNSPETRLFKKGTNLYGLDRARQAIRRTDQAIVVEGYMDVIIAHQYGFQNVVASLGTALTEQQIRQLKRLTRNLGLALDADAAGQLATRRGLEVARQVFDRRAVPVPTARGLVRYESQLDADIRILTLPAGLDPDEVIRAEPAHWERLVQQAQPVIDYVLAGISTQHDLTTPRGKSDAVNELAPLIREIADRVQQAHYVQRLGRLLTIDTRAIWDVVRQTRQPVPSARAPAAVRTNESHLEAYVLALILEQPDLLWQSDVRAEDFQDSACHQIFDALDEHMRDHEALDREALRQELDPSLHESLNRLESILTQAPPTSSPELLASLRVTLLRLRRRNILAENTQLQSMLTDAPADEQRHLQELTKRLSERLKQIDKALAASKTS